MLVTALTTLIVVLGGPVAPPPLVAAADLVYTFRTSESGPSHHTDDMTGTVHLHGDDVRIDVDRTQSDSDPGSYILVLDGGTRMLSVHPSRHEVDEINAATFERIIGTSLRAVGPLVKFHVRDLTLTPERLGAGGTMLGYATEHVRLTERYTVHITAMGFDGGDETVTAVNDYWVAPGVELGRNPLLALLDRAGTATAQSDAGFVQREDAARASLLRGTPLRTVSTVTTTEHDGTSKEDARMTEITSLRHEAQPAELFEVPSGYRVKGGSASIDM